MFQWVQLIKVRFNLYCEVHGHDWYVTNKGTWKCRKCGAEG